MHTTMNKHAAAAKTTADTHRLVVPHPSTCSTENFLDPEYSAHYLTLDEFLAEHGSSPDELNLCFRWDLERNELGGGFRALIFTVQQRKGIFVPVIIEQIEDDELDRLEVYLRRHWELLKKMWFPISSAA
jgi:hypothetical protein